MKRMWQTGLIGLLAIVLLQQTAFAESIEGRVAWADRENLGVVVYDAQGRPYPNTLTLRSYGGTQLNGIDSIEELRPNDPIGADIRQQENGEWIVDSITAFQQVNVKPATKKPSSSLSSVLGNPVVKGALLGAATGAIASSASHGKAGKGALIGAGVGALLGGIFNNSDNSNSN